MSTKTIYKRIALVAVATLGAGLLSVAPANADTLDNTPSAITFTTPVVTARVGDTVSSTFSFRAAQAATETVGTISTLTKPTGSAITVADGSTANGNQPTVNNTAKAATLTSTTFTSPLTKIVSAGTIAAGTDTLAGTVTFIPDRPGTYVYTLSGSSAADDEVATAVTATFTVTVRSLAYTTGDGAAVAPFNTGNGVAGPFNTVTVTGHSTQVADVRALVTVDGAGATISTGGTVAADFKSTVVAAAGNAAVVIRTPTAGTVTVSLFNETAASSGLFSSTAANTVTITVGATAQSGVVSAANSTSFIGPGTTQVGVDTAAVTAAATASTAVAANITVTVKDGATNDNTTSFLTASISGPGSLGIVAVSNQTLGVAGTNNVYGKNVTGATTANRIVTVYSDGTAGVATITISVGTTVIATETVTFVGAATAYTVAQTRKVYAIAAAAPGTPGDQTITVTVKDAAGNNVPNGIVVNATSASTSVATIGASATTTSGVATFTVSGVAAGTSVITFANATSSATVTATTTVTVGSATIASVSMTADKSSYLPGERVVVTVSAKSADGKPVADGVYTLFSTYPSSSMGLSVSALPTSGTSTLSGGDLVLNNNAPASEGEFKITANDNLTAKNLLSVAAAVEPNAGVTAATDAANEATDAANAATDAALAAAEAADAATSAAQEASDAVAALSESVTQLIAGLQAQIQALAKIVNKIAKQTKKK